MEECRSDQVLCLHHHLKPLLCWIVFLYLRTTGWSPHACACRLHQCSLVGWQQVILHGFDQVVFTRAAILNQRLLFNPLTQPQRDREPFSRQDLQSASVWFWLSSSLLLWHIWTKSKSNSEFILHHEQKKKMKHCPNSYSVKGRIELKKNWRKLSIKL